MLLERRDPGAFLKKVSGCQGHELLARVRGGLAGHAQAAAGHGGRPTLPLHGRARKGVEARCAGGDPAEDAGSLDVRSAGGSL